MKETIGQNMNRIQCRNSAFTLCAGQFTSRLSEDTVLMARTVCLNANVILRTFIKTMGTIYFMTGLSWKLTCLVLMETPVTAALQKVYSAYDQVKMGDGDVDLHKVLCQHRRRLFLGVQPPCSCPLCQRLSLALQNSMAAASEAVTESVSAIRVVKSFNAQKHEARRYGNLLKDINSLKIRQGTATAACLVAQRVSSVILLCPCR